MGSEIDGFDKPEKQLGKMQQGAKELENTETTIFDKLFTSSFMQNYTNFLSFDDFLKGGNFIVNSQEDFEAIPEDDMDIHVSNTTKFSCWEDMLNKATEIYVSKKLSL